MTDLTIRTSSEASLSNDLSHCIVDHPITGTLHHTDAWIPDLQRAISSWGWLLQRLGYTEFQNWPVGRSWQLSPTYIVVEESPALSASDHDRCRPGLNHLAFHVATVELVDAVTAQAPHHGWSLMFPDRHPYAGGEDHYVAYLEDVRSGADDAVAAARSRSGSVSRAASNSEGVTAVPRLRRRSAPAHAPSA